MAAGGGCSDIFFSRLSILFFLPLSGRRPNIDWNTVLSERTVKPKTTNQPSHLKINATYIKWSILNKHYFNDLHYIWVNGLSWHCEYGKFLLPSGPCNLIFLVQWFSIIISNTFTWVCSTCSIVGLTVLADAVSDHWFTVTYITSNFNHHYINTILRNDTILGFMFLSNTVSDLILSVNQYNLYFMVKRF